MMLWGTWCAQNASGQNALTRDHDIPSAPSALGKTITLDGNDTGRIFDGIGALSAGASSRLLIDYPEKQRDEILDYLFKPNFGAALQINKVEIGGDMNSTDGSEPSHMRTPDDENYQRGYEWWLMEESKKRNPDIKLYALEWGAPNWINPKTDDVWTQNNITYILNWVRHAKSDHHLTIDYLGGWNEKGFHADWYKQYRAALNRCGFGNTKVVAADSFNWEVGPAAAKDPEFAASFDIMGMHYPGTAPQQLDNWKACFAVGKPLWGSEIGSADYNGGAAGLAKLYNEGYIDSKMTAYINWSTIWSVLPGLPFSGDGLMLASEPWSGHYVVGLSIWATAHTTQFVQPGWQYLDGACKHLGGDPSNGSYVTLRSPNRKDFSLIAETVDAKASQAATFVIKGGLASSVLHVWRTDLRSQKDEDWFVKQADVNPEKGSFTVTFDPGCVYSLTTTVGQSKGMTTSPPTAPLALPYRDDFQEYSIGKTPRYFSDQHGTFEIAQATGGRKGTCLRQVVTAKPICWNSDADPGTLIGDPAWKNYSISSDIMLEQPGYIDLIGRVTSMKNQNQITGYHFRLTDKGHWSLFFRNSNGQANEKELASGDMKAATGINSWHHLFLSFVGKKISASIDDKVVADQVTDRTFASGLAGYQVSRWQNAQMMNFEVLPLINTMESQLVKLGAKVISCDSAAPDYPAAQAIDDNEGTIWHTVWIPNPAPLPHFLIIDVGKAVQLKGLTYLARQDVGNGRIHDCEIYLSDDTSNWGQPVATAKLSDTGELQTILFKAPASGRYLKFLAKTSFGIQPIIAVAELDILTAP